MAGRILYLLSQRPGRTGSGVTLDSQVRFSSTFGWKAAVVLGSPASDPSPYIGGLDSASIHPLLFERTPLDFSVPGMSDVMPYSSTRFSHMSAGMLDSYRRAWRDHLKCIIDEFKPDIIHSHHIWLLSSMVKDSAPDIPQVIQCHATGLRQMSLCPHLADEVKEGCARADRFQVLRAEHAMQLSDGLGVSLDRVHVVSSGYREDFFHRKGRRGDGSGHIVYVGKLSHAKGLPWLLDAFDRLREEKRSIELHVAGSGGDAEAKKLERRLSGMGGTTYHGMLDQASLGALLRKAEILALPSFYEGVPLVLVEALACGCKLVSTDLPGIRDRIAPAAGAALTTLPLPSLRSIDEPVEDDLPAFVENLRRALSDSLDDASPEPMNLSTFGWEAVFRKTESIYRELLGKSN